MTQYCAKLFFDPKTSERGVDRFAAGNAVLVDVVASVSPGRKVFNALFALRDGLVTKEAKIPLQEQ